MGLSAVLTAGVAFTTIRYVSIALGAMIVASVLTSVFPSVAAVPDSNNDFATAIEVRNNDVVSDSVDDADDLSDFYMIYLESDESVDAHLEMPWWQDFDLYLYGPGPSYELLAWSEIENGVINGWYEYVSFQVASTGWYYLEVYAFYGYGDYRMAVTATADWTVMVYLDGDCSLESDAIGDFLEMSSIGSTSAVNIVVQFDRWNPPSDPSDNTSFGDWTDCERFFVTQGMTPDLSNSLESLGEVNMGDPQTLIDFGNMTIQNFPAHHYALVLWNHGGSWSGVCWDDSMLPVEDQLTMPELGSALSSITAANDLPTLDVVWLDACNMASIEVAYEISSYCSNMVGSEKTEPGTGANYGLTLAALTSNPSMTPEELCGQVVSDYVTSYDDSPEPGYMENDVTQSASSMTEIPLLVASVNSLAGELCTNIMAYVNYVNQSWTEAEYYDDVYEDLHDLAWKLTQYLPPGLARSYAFDVMSGVNSTVFAEGHWDAPGEDTIALARGLTIYFPYSLDFDESYGSSGVGFSSNTQWDEFLTAYYVALAAGNDPPTILTWSPLSDPTIDEGGFVVFEVDVSDPDGNAISYTWSMDAVEIPSAGAETYTFTAGPDDQGEHSVSVEVWDGAEYVWHNWTLTVIDVPPNTPPVAAFAVTPNPGSVSEEFSFNASSSTDAETPLSGLEFRWDFDGDGTWDTGWLADPTVTHQFVTPGNYTVRLEVRDEGGFTNISELNVDVWEVIPEFGTLPSVVIVFLAAMLLTIVTRRRNAR